MPLIPDEWIERLKTDVSLVLLAERSGMTLKKVGQELMGRCPFPPHEDQTPSLSINEDKNFFQCFGCGAAGTSIDWTMREKGLKFRPAVELLLRDFFPSAAEELLDRAQRRGTRQSAPELPCPFHFEASDQEILKQYVDHCHALFKESAEPQDYLVKRGLDSSELVSRFRLGYQDRTLGLRLPTPTTKAGEEIRERFKRLGLIRESGHGSFVGSLLIPTIDLSGNVTGIYARKTRDDLNKDHSSPRHLYLRGDDDDVFNEEAFVSSKEIILTEARIDALSFWRWASTQAHVHLTRLLELEYVLAHRAPRGQGFVYELLWRGEGLDERPFVLGLVDIETLRERAGATERIRSQAPVDSGLIRAGFGPDSGAFRSEQSSTSPNAGAAFLPSAADGAENALLPPERKIRSYTLRRTHRAPRFNLLRFPPNGNGYRPHPRRDAAAGFTNSASAR